MQLVSFIFVPFIEKHSKLADRSDVCAALTTRNNKIRPPALSENLVTSSLTISVTISNSCSLNTFTENVNVLLNTSCLWCSFPTGVYHNKLTYNDNELLSTHSVISAGAIASMIKQ